MFENTRTCVRNILNQGENVFPLQGEEERIVLCALLLLLILLSTLFSFPVTYKDGQSLL